MRKLGIPGSLNIEHFLPDIEDGKIQQNEIIGGYMAPVYIE